MHTIVHAVRKVRQPVPRSTCTGCNVRELCLPAGLNADELAQLDDFLKRRRRLARGSYLFRAGAPLQSLFAIHTGSLKSVAMYDDGREQIIGFHLGGELMGIDAISTGAHACDAIALEDSEVCEILFADLQQLTCEIPALQRRFHCLMGSEIVRDYGMMMLLGNMRAKERLAAFLVNIGQRLYARGCSSTQLILRMTRGEIGSYLGLKLETVSRTLSCLKRDGLIAVERKLIQITNLARLKIVAQGAEPAPAARFQNRRSGGRIRIRVPAAATACSIGTTPY